MSLYANLTQAQRADITARLVNCYGADRAALILAGHDSKANRDHRRWRGIGGEAYVKPQVETASQRHARIVRLYEQGVEPEHLAERFSLSRREVDRVLQNGGYARRGLR